MVRGFTLPLVLFLISFIALISMSIYVRQNDSIKTLHFLKLSFESVSSAQRLKQYSIQTTFRPLAGIKRQEIQLDGLYNVSHLVQTNALGGRRINENQVTTLQRILSDCRQNPGLAKTLAQRLLSIPKIEQNDGILNLIQGFDLSPTEMLNLIICVRLSSPLNKLNLYFATQQTLASLFNLSSAQATKLQIAIKNGKLENISQVKVFLKELTGNSHEDWDTVHMQLSQNSKNKAVYWTHLEKTFAFFDIGREIGEPWAENWNVILWMPEVFNE